MRAHGRAVVVVIGVVVNNDVDKTHSAVRLAVSTTWLCYDEASGYVDSRGGKVAHQERMLQGVGRRWRVS